jgi:hypothetical protein
MSDWSLLIYEPVQSFRLLLAFVKNLFSIYPEDGGDTFLRNVNYQQDYMVSYPRILQWNFYLRKNSNLL